LLTALPDFQNELGPTPEIRESQEHRFQLKECAQQLVRMNNVATTFSMGVNNPTPAITSDGAAIAPGPTSVCQGNQDFGVSDRSIH